MSTYPLTYFRPTKLSFWRWEDAADVIAGISGNTICYRSDLLVVMKEVALGGLPGLSNILLCLAACREGNEQVKAIELSLQAMQQMFKDHEAAEISTFLKHYIQDALALMNLVSGLPSNYRTDKSRIHLINELFAPSQNKIPPVDALKLIDDFAGGQWDFIITHQQYEKHLEGIKEDIVDLRRILTAYKDSDSLWQKLKSGIIGLPQKADVEIPKSDDRGKTLLTELEEDHKTAGVALLARQLIAALNIPMHTANAGDQSYGGISDISNRGNFDRLLLSELANDDLTLMARLVNNEALYLRREAPPDIFERTRNILIDTTIKMWGLPRVFSVSAALACAQNLHHVASVQVFALGQDDYQDIEINTKEGVLNALQKMDAGLHSCLAVLSFLEEQKEFGESENILITGEDFLHNPAFYRHHDEIQQQLKFLIIVNRTGDLQLYEMLNGRRKLINTGKFDLEQILQAKGTARRISTEILAELPVLYNQHPLPLHFPSARVSLKKDRMFNAKADGFVGITETNRVLHWPSSKTGARQLTGQIAPGHYCFGTTGSGIFYLFVYNCTLSY